MAKILIVDDDPTIRDVVRFALLKAGFETLEAETGKAALESFAANQPDLIVLDVTMPELDGSEVCRRIRRDSAVPILFLSSRDEEFDRVLGLELGGDDYLVKPFDIRELSARVEALLRRGGDARLTRLQVGPLEMDLVERSVRCDSKAVDLLTDLYD